jgi:hypothetical protein
VGQFGRYEIEDVRFWGQSGHRLIAAKCLLLTQFRHLMTNWAQPSRFQDIPGLSGRIDPEAKPAQRSRQISMI